MDKRNKPTTKSPERLISMCIIAVLDKFGWPNSEMEMQNYWDLFMEEGLPSSVAEQCMAVAFGWQPPYSIGNSLFYNQENEMLVHLTLTS